MTIQETASAKVQQLPDTLAQQVSDYIDFLLVKNDSARAELWAFFLESQELARAGLANYWRSLEDYEERLARGEIKWQE
jgi:hypothetical protein